MSAEPVAPFVHGDLPYPSATAARAAWQASRAQREATHVTAAQAWVVETLAVLGDTPIGRVAAIHLPDPRETVFHAPEALWCDPCGDCCGGRESFPCGTMEVVLEALPATHPPAPVFTQSYGVDYARDFWRDPEVTVVLAHHWAYRGEGGGIITQLPGSTLTLRHSEARRMLSYLTTASADLVRSLS